MFLLSEGLKQFRLILELLVYQVMNADVDVDDDDVLQAHTTANLLHLNTSSLSRVVALLELASRFSVSVLQLLHDRIRWLQARIGTSRRLHGNPDSCCKSVCLARHHSFQHL